MKDALNLPCAPSRLVGVLLASLGLFSAATLFAAETVRRPNILFIAVDDLRPELGCYGCREARSPNIDRLAASGMRLDRHYVQFAVCIPSRVALLTSLRSERTHQIYGPPVWQKIAGARPWGETFKAGGYSTVSLGKIWHVEGGPVGRDTFDVKWTPAGGQYADPAHEALKNRNQQARLAQKGKGKTKGASVPPPADMPPITECAEVPDNVYPDGQTGDRAIEEIRRLKSAGKPFMLAVGFFKPHLPFCAPKKYWDLYDEGAMSLAPNPELPRDMPEVAFSGHPNMFNYSYGDYAPLQMGQRMPDRTARHLIRAYRACVSFTDAQVGRLLDELEALGLTQDTIVVLWGDHGWHLGDSGLWSKHTNFEAATWAPLIVRAPGTTKLGTHSRALVETVDILPTLLDLCGLPALPVSDGRSFRPVLEHPERPWKSAVFHVFDRHRVIDGKNTLILGFAVRTPTHRLVSWRVGWDLEGREIAAELYDYVSDPHETRNLAGDPAQADLRRALEGLRRAGWNVARPKP